MVMSTGAPRRRALRHHRIIFRSGAYGLKAEHRALCDGTLFPHKASRA
jgi:hypothetical protein